jgi:hypothetical protein
MVLARIEQSELVTVAFATAAHHRAAYAWLRLYQARDIDRPSGLR